MRHNRFKKGLVGWVLVLALICTMSGPSLAVDYFLVAGQFSSVPMPDGTVVAMWGFGQDPSCAIPADVPACFTDLTPAVLSSPGPRLMVPPGDDLNIWLYNDGLPEPVSLIIPGLEMPKGAGGTTGPTWTDGTTGGRGGNLALRVRSFGLEAAAGAVQEYHWTAAGSNAPKDGSFIYQSGTHPQVQIQMGLYGAITRNFGAGEAYDSALISDASATFLHERILFYSEIDPELHAAVAGGTYGTPAGPTSTIDYRPAFYRFTDAAGTTTVYTSAAEPTVDLTCTPGETVLLRHFNIGLQTHVPALGHYFDLIAEDGNPYPFPRRQYSVLLPAGKTQDGITLCDGAVHNVLDRSTYASRTTPAPPANRNPVAVNDNAATTPGTPVLIDVLANDYDLDLDIVSISAFDAASAQGGLVLCAADCTYTPPAAPPPLPFTDTFMYTVADGFGGSASATVSIDVDDLNGPPVTSNAAYAWGPPPMVPVDITLGATDPDTDPLTIILGAAPAHGTLTSQPMVTYPGDHWLYTPDDGFKGDDTFTFTAHDGTETSNVATVTITVSQINNVPVAVNDDVTTPDNLAPFFNVLSNDTDADGDPLSFVSNTAPTCGSVICTPAGDCSFTPPAAPASCTFDYDVTDGADADTGTVTVTVTAAAAGDVFTDNFNRPVGTTVGNGWTEVEILPEDLQLGPTQP